MKRILACLIILSTLFTSTTYAYQYNDPHTFQSQLETARSKTVRVVLYNIERYTWDTYTNLMSSGSGTLIGDGYILTNAHVIAATHNEIEVTTYDNQRYSAEIIKVDERKDLALLQIDSTAEGFTLSDVSLYRGKPIMTIGQPAGLPHWSFSEGTVQTPSCTYEDTGGSTQNGIQTDAWVKGGASGGPLLDERGELVGIIRAGGDDYSYAIPMDDIKTFLEGITYE
jgi:serine protease Do